MLILASKSPRRKELLSYITKDFTVKSADVDETLPNGISLAEAVLYLSKIKALPFKDGTNTIIGADTVVALNGTIFGKPKDEEDAKRMLRLLSGEEHSVFTGVTIVSKENVISFAEETKVKFYHLTDKIIDDYIMTKEPLDKAGAYGIQGKGSLLVEKIDGDFFNVVGLPIGKLNKILETTHL